MNHFTPDMPNNTLQEKEDKNAPLTLLENVYGFNAFRGEQANIIESALQGNDSLVLIPTGGGKSVCYQIPALLRSGTGIVISPLIALMQDQVSALLQLGIRAAFLNSTLSAPEQNRIRETVIEGNIDILYVAPERINQPATLSWLKQVNISLIAIDEAHCVSQWGHDFRQDYLALSHIKESFPNVPRMALTATATPQAQQEIADKLALTSPQWFVSSFDRPNIHYSVAAKAEPRKQLLRFITNHRDESGIVYCLSRKSVESTAEFLNGRGVTALPYHAGLSDAIRAENQARFQREDNIVMVATIAFGMGIDKPDIRFVVHINLPKSMESYYQETGRAGRDGEPAEAMLLYGLDDVVQLARFIDQSDAHQAYKQNQKQKLDQLLGWCEATTCRRISLLHYFGETFENNCGNCDNCLNPPQTWDATEDCRKLLSCVYRLEQRFGTAHTIEVLRGSQSEKIERFNHQNLSTYGIGTNLSQPQWRSITRQLLVRGYLVVNAEQYGALQLTEKSRAILRGETKISLRKETMTKKETRSSHKTSHSVSDNDKTLWNELRGLRNQLAKDKDIPPYLVFHDATLMEMMETHPQTSQQLLQISGVGEAKLALYGAAFLELIQAHAN